MSYSEEPAALPKKRAKKAPTEAVEAGPNVNCTHTGCTKRWTLHSPDQGIIHRCREHAQPEEQKYSVLLARIRGEL